jgi:hypothetical protein
VDDTSSKELAEKFLQFKAKFHSMVKALDEKLAKVNYNVVATFGAARINLNEPNRPTPLLDIGLPFGTLEASKQEKDARLSLLGFELLQHDSIETTVDFFANGVETVFDKYEYLKEFYNRIKTI